MLKWARNRRVQNASGLNLGHPSIRGCTSIWQFASMQGDKTRELLNGWEADFSGTRAISYSPRDGAINFTTSGNPATNTGIAASTFLSGSLGTISAWVMIPASSTFATYPYSLGQVVTDTQRRFGISVYAPTTYSNPDPKIWFWVRSQAGTDWAQVDVDYTVGTWTHLVWVLSGGILTAYKDGRSIVSISPVTTIDDMAGAMQFGAGGCSIDEIRTWDRAISSPEIWNLYANPAAVFRPVRRYWTLAYVRGTATDTTLPDKPFFVGNNVLELSDTAATWQVPGDSDDITAATAPTWLAYDRKAKAQTFPTIATLQASEATSVSLNFRMVPSSASVGQCDTVAILGHNFADIYNIGSVSIDIADGADFEDATRIATWTAPFDRKRLVKTNLVEGDFTNRLFANINYARVVVALDPEAVGDDALFYTPPKIGEVILGKRQQLTMGPQEPLDDPISSGAVGGTRGDTGEVVRHAMYSGAGDRKRKFWVGGVSTATIDPEVSIRTWFEHTGYGQRSFLYVEEPSTVETDRRAHYMLLEDPALSIMAEGPYIKTVELSMLEVAPFVEGER